MSNRLTFSLASLILIMALGLVFAPVSVMAHDPLSDGAVNPVDTRKHPDGLTQGTHLHPSIEVTIGDGMDANPNTTGFDVVDANDDTEAAGSTGPTITFDVTLTLPVGAEASNSAVVPDTFKTAPGVTGTAYYSNFLPVGTVTFGDWTAGTGDDANKWTASLTINLPKIEAGADDAATTAARNKAKADAIEKGTTVDIIVAANMIQTTGLVGGLTQDQPNLESTTKATVIAMKVDEETVDPDPVTFKVSGTPSLTDPFTVTFTSTSMDDNGMLMGAMIVVGDVEISGGYVENPLSLQPDPSADPANTVWNVIVWPYPATTMVSVTIKDNPSTAAAADADMGTLSLSKPEATLNTITAADGADDTAPFLVTLTFAEALSEGVMFEAADLMVTPATATVGTPSVDAADAKMWHVLITPTAGMDTKIELSEAGMVKFSYSGSAVTVMKKTTAPTVGEITAEYDAATMETSLSGMIGANDFVVVGAASLRDLEEFFDIGGTIGLHDADAADGNDKNSREVVMSEILWGLDFGATAIADQKQWQFIELYNTTSSDIDLTGWTLKFTEGRPVPKKDVDQVSNRAGAGWHVDIGQSGRVTGTTAADAENLITPIYIKSMYRNINYDQVEKVKTDGTPDPDRNKQLEGTKDGNNKDEWKVSTRRDPATPDGIDISGAEAARWIYSSRGREHYTTTAILTASGVSGSPFRINEIGNDSGSDNDWVEIHNVSDAEASLKNYALSKVTAKGTDTKIFDFKDQDWKVPAKGFVVISTRHPRDTDLAAGKDISKADDDEENRGASHLFVVKSVDLPDDGKFALILRNAHDKQGGDGHLVDVVATRQGSFADPNIGTSLWPLKATGLPHDNVIDGGDENFASGKVYQRNSGNGRDEKQFAVRGYTGVGYDRAAASTGSNGGTPGYDNGAVKDKIAGLTDGSIAISEIMVDSGETRQNLAQWIELHNTSMTQAVSLSGWKLHIENAANGNGDLETNTFSATLSLDAMTISPNQTILIVTTTGITSDPDHFPSTRVVNLWTTKKHRDALEMQRRTDPVLSTTGFNITLADKDGNEVDSAGNLDGNRKTRDNPAWILPMGEDDNRRSSMVRVYDDGVAIDGRIEEAWMSADATNLAWAISHTYYGSPDDFGTPGFRAGGPLPVSLSKFRPERLDDGSIRIVWITESELNNAGFNILRSEKRDSEFKQINTKLIAGQGTTSERTTYTHVDTSAKPNVVYYYQIQDVSLDGKVQTLRQSRLKGHISPAGKLTTIWGELKALQ